MFHFQSHNNKEVGYKCERGCGKKKKNFFVLEQILLKKKLFLLEPFGYFVYGNNMTHLQASAMLSTFPKD